MDQLYQERILELARVARAALPIDLPTHHATVSNPTCGDRADVSFVMQDGIVADASVAVRGCALCEAGAGLMLGIAAGRSRDDLARMRAALAAWLAGDDDADIDDGMAAFAPVRAIKNRHKCVTLAFDAAAKAAASQT